MLQNESLYLFMRRSGYRPYGRNSFSFIKNFSNLDFPRFHIYVQEDSGAYHFNLHLDMKKPIYKNVTAHSGEYAGKLLKKEKERILSFAAKRISIS